MTDERTARRLDVAEHIAVQQLYASQSLAIDTGQAEQWAATFTEDGVFASPTYGRPIVGAQALVQFAAEVQAKLGTSVQRHHLSNLVVTPLEADRAVAHCYALITVTPVGEPAQLARSVAFTDDLVRSAGRWRVRHRTVQVDGLPGEDAR